MGGWFSSSSRPSGPEDLRARDAPARRGGRDSDDDEARRTSREDGTPSRHARGGHQGGHTDQQRLSGSSAVMRAKDYLRELTGQPSESVSSLTRRPDGGWRVRLEVVELERIPRTTDILASYEVQLDAHGEMLSYERVGRYYRNAATAGDE